MLEAVFGSSAAGSMSVAMMGRTGYIGGAVSVIIRKSDGRKPSRAEIRKAQQEAELRERLGWAEAVPLEGRREDILSFNLLLSVGAIDEAGVGPIRKSVLCSLYSDSTNEVERLMEEAQKNLSVLMERAGKGESVRVWSSGNPDEACGLCWLMEQMRPIGFEKLDITLVRLPAFLERPDGSIVRYTAWGDVEPYQLGRMALSGEKLSVHIIRMLANRWKQLQQDNSPLRAVLNGRIVSASESLYDSYILQEIAVQNHEFHEAAVVGNVIGKYRLGIGDGWIALRIDQFIHDGLLEPVTQAGRGSPAYRRILRKCITQSDIEQ